MKEDRNGVGYAVPASAEQRARAGYGYALLGLQLLWAWPAAFGAMVVTCNYGLVGSLAANLACAVVGVAPSLLAIALAASIVLRHPRPDAREVTAALVAMFLALAIVVYAFYATVGEWMHPGPSPCP